MDSDKTPNETKTTSFTDHDRRPQDLLVTDALVPSEIEEFTIGKLLGRGGFDTVFVGFDTILQREVAVKIPHPSLVMNGDAAELYLREARAMASLEHPNILPVYRAASTPQIPCYIVSKLIRGSSLAVRLRESPPSVDAAINLLACVSDALAFTHSKGIVHRDIKPGNILLDEAQHPYVSDFGLALRDADLHSDATYVGTPAYMSPEQASGEGHRVDCRSTSFRWVW